MNKLMVLIEILMKMMGLLSKKPHYRTFSKIIYATNLAAGELRSITEGSYTVPPDFALKIWWESGWN
jgi:hypothetical protein